MKYPPSENNIATPVVIVGGGPVGLTLAIELGFRRIPCILLEAKSRTSTEPKCMLVNMRSMEHFRRMGLADTLRLRGLSIDHPLDIVFATRVFGYLIARLPYASRLEVQQTGNRTAFGNLQGPELPQRISQIFLEPTLQEVANSFPSVSVRFGWSVEEVTQDKEGVMVRVLEIENGRRHTISARYIAACDGGSSPIRTATKTKLQGEFSLGSQMAIFFRSSELRNNPQGRVMMWILANRDLFGAIIAVDGQDLFTFHHLLTSATRPIDYNASQALRAALGRDIDFDIISVNHWTSHLALVERYRRGRVFFVGDAAHLLVPNAGLGMNTGIADACDLGWKLSAVSQGWADESLLNSYELERRPIAQRNLAFAKTAVEQLNFSNMSPNIEDGGPTGEALRQKFRQVTEERRPKELESIGLQLGYRYRNSPICVSDGTPEQNDDFGLYVPTARPGARAPHTVLDDGTVLYDLLGDWFTLLRLGGSKVSTSALEASAAKYSVPLKVLDILQPDVRALFETDLVLIRPDQHVAWRGQELPRDPDTVINCIRGALVALATKQSTGN